jgi:hypothetical protein
MLNIITAPQNYNINDHPSPLVFLAGSIESGTAIKWQDEVCKRLSLYDLTILNPRRNQWMDLGDQNLEAQIKWELHAIQKSNIVLMYFDENTKSPITLLELGLICGTSKSAIICCPKGFWRRKNVEVTCKWYGRTLLDDFDDMLDTFISVLGRRIKVGF